MNQDQLLPFAPIALDRGMPPLYLQLARKLTDLICQKKLTPGFPLPPVRQLAGLLGINPGTVVAAYRELEKSGYILTRRGSGSYVADQSGPALPMLGAEEPSGHIPCPAADLSRIAIDPALFPTQTMKSVISRIIDRDGAEAFTAGGTQGYLPLREAIAASLAAEHIHTDAAHIQIVSGAQQGIDIAARALLRHGSFVITESPSYPGAFSLFRACGAKVADLPLTKEGLDLRALENLVIRFRPSLLYVTPDVQAPTGMTYSIQTKARMLALARRYNFYILEDDYANGLFYGAAPKTMKALDSHDRVLYLRSVSSLFAAGLRLAFLIMPDPLAPMLKKVKYLSDIATAGLTQRVLDLYLREGHWDPHVDMVRRESEKKRAAALAALAEAPSLRAAPPAGGLSLWVTLPEGTSAREVLLQARREGYLFADGAPFYPRQNPDRHLRVSFGNVREDQIRDAFRLLERLAESGQNAGRSK